MSGSSNSSSSDSNKSSPSTNDHEEEKQPKTDKHLVLSDSDEDKKVFVKAERSNNETNQNDAKEALREKLLAGSDSDDDDNASDKSEVDVVEQAAARNLVLSDTDEEAPIETEMIVDDIPTNRLKLGDLGPVYVRLPNFLSIEPKPFDPRTYEQEDDDEVVDAEGRARMKLKIENTIRWRNFRDPRTGEVQKQSNAKIVKWSDGTMSLHLGNEIFEIQDQKSMPNLHLFTRQGASLQAQSAFQRKFAFRPHSTDTLTHRKMTMGMADKSNRVQKIKMVTSVGVNPEKSRKEIIKKEEEKLRAFARKQAAQYRSRQRTREIGISSGFLEGYDSDDENVGALKRSYGGTARSGTMNPYVRGNIGPSQYYSEEESEEEESQRSKSLREAKQRIESSDEEMPDESQETPSVTDNQSGSRPRKAPTGSARRHRIIEDDDE